MRKLLLSTLVVFPFLTYSLRQHTKEKSLPPIATPDTKISPTPTIQLPNQLKGRYKNGQYTGDVADAFYGIVQVKVVVEDGKITDVKFLDYPRDRRTSVEINTQAIPLLKSEAITAQDANVDIVSGATQTSMAFIESLKSALKKAS